ncbi:MAG: hypothetical protein K6T85_12765 [Gorillibacterium sp.]|nr:hypothetical protein [Gorillibacterium sp.]
MNREELVVYCDLVKKGKPAACIPLQTRHVEEALVMVGKELLTHVEHLSDGWVTFWIYKYPHILEAIKNTPQTPKTAYDHWVLGKLFGYEEVAIQEFIETTLS